VASFNNAATQLLISKARQIGTSANWASYVSNSNHISKGKVLINALEARQIQASAQKNIISKAQKSAPIPQVLHHFTNSISKGEVFTNAFRSSSKTSFWPKKQIFWDRTIWFTIKEYYKYEKHYYQSNN
jgi:hypothetical protein